MEHLQSVQRVAGADTDWHDIQTKGYVVIRSFLLEPELDFLLKEFTSAVSFPNAKRPSHAKYKMVSQAVLDAFLPTLTSTAALVTRETDLHIDTLTGGVYFAISLGTDLGWHQDHESFYQFGDHYHYLNFYIPFQKPVRAKSNLSLIPLDELARRSPRVFNERKGQGACAASSLLGRTVLRHHDRGGVSVIPFDLNEIAVTPELEAGDLLLLRGDVFHKTQDTETDRIAISFRMISSETIVRRKSLVSFQLSYMYPHRGRGKFWGFARNRQKYETFSKVFEEAGRNELRAEEFVSGLKRIQLRNRRGINVSWRQFLATLTRNWIATR